MGLVSPPPEAQDDSAWVARRQGGGWGLVGEGREEAEDVVQEIFLKAYLALPHFREDARFSTWLYRIAVNHCRDVARRAPPPHVELDEARLESLADERS